MFPDSGASFVSVDHQFSLRWRCHQKRFSGDWLLVFPIAGYGTATKQGAFGSSPAGN
jgi:hypothetical protein